MPICRRTADRVGVGRVDVLTSSSRTSPSAYAPEISSCMRFSERRNVDFPQPEEPISAVTLFGWIVMLTSLTARNFP